MVAVWLYMAVSGLLIAEANLYVRQQKDQEEAGLLATIAYLLGKGGAIAAGILYIFMHYALLVAYTARGGDILAMAARNLAWLPLPTVPLWWGHVWFAALLAGLLYFGSETFVAQFNSVLLGGVIAAFMGLVGLTVGGLEGGWIDRSFHLPMMPVAVSWQALGTVVPVMLVAFVFHNVVPVVAKRLEGNKPKICQAILWGSFIPLLMFLVWNAVILISVGEAAGDPIELLRQGANSPRIGLAISVFSELAVATSFIGFVYGLMGFLEDVLPPGVSQNNGAKFALVFLPPIVFSVLSPTVFFDAIEVAGAFGVSLLFGVLPAVMVWKLRYVVCEAALVPETLVPGKKVMLVAIASLAAMVFSEQAVQLLAL